MAAYLNQLRLILGDYGTTGCGAQSGRSASRSIQAHPHHGPAARLIRRQIVVAAQGVLHIARSACRRVGIGVSRG